MEAVLTFGLRLSHRDDDLIEAAHRTSVRGFLDWAIIIDELEALLEPQPFTRDALLEA